MKLNDDLVTFVSDDDWFFAEEGGLKPCTLRLLSDEEWCELNARKPERIRIVRRFTDEYFTREVSGTYWLGELLGNHVVLIYWWDEFAGEDDE